MITLTPAYGRDYKSADALKKDWDAGKDFIINDITSCWDGKPANKESLAGAGMIQFRYNKLRKVITGRI